MITIDSVSYKKVLFIHVPKTGGTSISKYLIENNLDNWIRMCPVRHDPYFLLQKNNHIDDLTFTFSVVRNPFTRMYSYYHHYNRIHQKNISFLNFLLFIKSRERTIKTPWITFPQYHFIFDDFGKISIKKIYKFETINELENDFSCKLTHENIGSYNFEQYLSDYSDQCISLVKHICLQDFISFEYSNNFYDSF